LLRLHEAHEHVFVGQFFLECLGIKTVQHVVVFNGGMATNSLEAAMMVGKDQSVGRNHHARAIAREVDNSVLNGVFALIDVGVWQFKALGLHLLVHCLWQIVQRPHAFVGLCRAECHEGS